MKILPFICALLLLTFADSCVNSPPPALRAEDNKLIDSLYREYVSVQKPIADSLCQLTFDSRVQVIVDSIMLERNREIERYLERIKALQ